MQYNLAEMVWGSLKQTLYMASFASLCAVSLGLILGVALTITDRGRIIPLPYVNKALDTAINLFRSIPDLIMIVLLLPLARLLVGTSLGSTAAIVPLAIVAAPFIGRIIENSLKEVEQGKIEAALAMGTTPGGIVWKVLIPEALPSLVRGITLAMISIISLTAIAGAVGGGGLGSLAIRYGYERFRNDVLIATVVVLTLLVQGIQWGGNGFARYLSKKRHNVG